MNSIESMIDGPAELAYVALLFLSVMFFWQFLRCRRVSKMLERELGRGMRHKKIWIELQLARWRAGKLKSRTIKLNLGMGYKEVLEPEPGHLIVLSVTRYGRRSVYHRKRDIP